MTLTIHIKRGLRGRFWWKLVDETGEVRAVCPPPGFVTSSNAHNAARRVLRAECAEKIHEHKARWWQFWA